MIDIKNKLPEDIDYYQINEIRLDPITLDLIIGIIDPINPNELFSVGFKNLAYFSLSKTAEDTDGIFQIGCIELFHCKNPNSLPELISHELTTCLDLEEVYYLKIEGDIFIEAVSNSISLSS